ncbi:NACHT domain-containing protein [Streptomyces camelliae]|uniref:AAA+ ATPase domain-containing protein n=1 Tax=Streptomyces camelliae TaxID=3004093 RepID=A0ABY7P8P2_9ACTN|nr:hypothetical protein [Streptomyces sp. HUAS 2-6]WBO66630.1 hypothetical protein O1G22_29430 [Streptomyces sp. HUAS 2-6]
MAAAVPGPVGEFCAALGRLVRACGVPQVDIAAALDLSAGSVSALLNGNRRKAPEWDVVQRIVLLCAERHRSREPLPGGLRLDVAWWRGRYGELEGAVESGRGQHRRAPAEGPPPTTASLKPLGISDCVRMGIDDAVRLLADGRPGLADAADRLLGPLDAGATDSHHTVLILLDGFPERVRAAHGLRRGALLQAARTALVTVALVRCGPQQLGREGVTQLVGDLVNRAAPNPAGAGPDAPTDAFLLARIRKTMPEHIQQQLIDHYLKLATRLATACPEFALAVGQPDKAVSGTEDGAGTGLAGLGALLTEFAGRTSPAVAGHARLNDPIAELDRRGPQLPSLAEGYVNPRFRLAGPYLGSGAEDRVASDKWWEDQPTYETIERFLAAYLLNVSALRSPLVVLGHPGAGKSLLTKLLAARLPTAEFRPLRVELRHTPAEADLQTQLEHALKQQTGRAVSWPDWSEAVTGTIPVLLLDGFDELLQAGAQLLDSARQWSYLREVEQFQKREAEQGRPLIVLVTSRTVVADRAEIPPHSQVLRLEPFGAEEIGRWLETWNTTNRRYFAEHDLTPLTYASLLPHLDLAAQPLLLLMLALYDAAVGNGLGLPLDNERLSRTQLYERLFTEFVRRQVVKDGPLPATEQTAAVDRELHRLSVIALGMLHRGAQAITGEQADGDLRALAPESPGREPLGAEPLFGRFFFVHEAQAVVTDQRLRSYEFLHATFGEHLAARLIDGALRRLAESGSQDDGELYALLSFTPLTDRDQLPRNLGDMLAAWPDGEARERLPGLLAARFRQTEWGNPHRTDPGHAPTTVTRTYRNAVYEVNLLLITVLAAGEVYASAFVGTGDLVDGWRRQVLLWQSQLSSESWDLLSSALHPERCERDGKPDLRISTRQAPLLHHELNWQLGAFGGQLGSSLMLPEDVAPSGLSGTERRVMFVGDSDAELLLHAVHPLLHQMSGTLRSHLLDAGGSVRSAAQSLVALLSRDRYDTLALPDLYLRCLRHLEHLTDHERIRYLEAVVCQLRHDADILSDDALLHLVLRLDESLGDGGFVTAAAQRALLDFIHSVVGRGGGMLAVELASLQDTIYRIEHGDKDNDPLDRLLRLTKVGRSSGTWLLVVGRGKAATPLFDDVLAGLDLTMAAARHPSAVIDLLRLAADLGLDDWLAGNAARLLAALPAEAFALLRPTDLPHLRAALPEGAYAAEFARLERIWRGPAVTPPAETLPPHSPPA